MKIEMTCSLPLLPARLAASAFPPRTADFGAPPDAEPGERLLGRRVLIVEDEALLAMELEFALLDEGAEVVGPALSLDAALRLIEAGPPIDCALLDVDLGGRDVYPAAHLLARRGIPIVFHTGHGSPHDLARLFPGSETVLKPSRTATLIDRLARH